jgi:AAA+ superfamily predicted ATPase
MSGASAITDVFSGEVGTGKTTLADSFGDPIAREENIPVRVLRLSLITRGRGAVGEMTHLISRAFDEVESLARPAASGSPPASAVFLVIDEADALAESRAMEQMHHEDRAGVNALIRGIDQLLRKRLPVLVVLCTNRDEAIDPAVLRRAAAHHHF